MTTDSPAAFEDLCPEWCDRDHSREQPSLDERRHQSEPARLPVTVLHRRSRNEVGPRRWASAEDAWVLAMTYAGDSETWIAVATEHQQIELTPESARRVHVALGELLNHVG